MQQPTALVAGFPAAARGPNCRRLAQAGLEAVFRRCGRQGRAAVRLGPAAERLSAGQGSKGERLYDWTLIQSREEDGWSHGLLVRRSMEEQPEHAYYWFYAPACKATLETLVRVAGQRWQIEQAFQAAKGECGLDHYEVRHWQGWYRTSR